MGDSIAPFQSIQQALDTTQSSRRFSGAFLASEDRALLVTTESQPAITASHAFASLIGSDKKLRKSTTRRHVPDYPVFAFEQKWEPRRSRAFFESDRRKDSIGPSRRERQQTPAVILLRKASKQYDCAGFGTAAPRDRVAIAAELLREELEQVPLNPDGTSSRSSRSSIRHPLIETSGEGHRAEPTGPALTINEVFGHLPQLVMASGNACTSSDAIEEARRKSITSRITTRTNSQEIIWKKDGTPSSWSHSRSGANSTNLSSRNSEGVRTPVLPDQFPPHASAVLPTLPEEHAQNPEVGPSGQRLCILEDPSGGWPWDVEPSPIRSGLEAHGDREHFLAERSPSPAEEQFIHVPRTRPADPGKSDSQQAAEEKQPLLLDAGSPSMSPGLTKAPTDLAHEPPKEEGGDASQPVKQLQEQAPGDHSHQGDTGAANEFQPYEANRAAAEHNLPSDSSKPLIAAVTPSSPEQQHHQHHQIPHTQLQSQSQSQSDSHPTTSSQAHAATAPRPSSSPKHDARNQGPTSSTRPSPPFRPRGSTAPSTAPSSAAASRASPRPLAHEARAPASSCGTSSSATPLLLLLLLLRRSSSGSKGSLRGGATVVAAAGRVRGAARERETPMRRRRLRPGPNCGWQVEGWCCRGGTRCRASGRRVLLLLLFSLLRTPVRLAGVPRARAFRSAQRSAPWAATQHRTKRKTAPRRPRRRSTACAIPSGCSVSAVPRAGTPRCC